MATPQQAYGPLPAGYSWGLDPSGNPVPLDAQGRPHPEVAPKPDPKTTPAAQTPTAAQAYGPLPKGAASWGLDPSGNPVALDASGNPLPTAKQTAAKATESAKQKTQDTLNHLNDLVANAPWTSINGQGAGALGNQIGNTLAQLPNQVAQNWLNQHKNVLQPGGKATQLFTAINNAASTYQPAGTKGAAATQPQPVWDPLTLQTMWKDVFGPAWSQAVAGAKTSGDQYLTAMQKAIAGGGGTPQQQAQSLQNAKSMAGLLNSYGTAQSAASAAQIPFDTLLSQLQQASATSQAAQGQYEKVYGVQQAAATAPYYTGQTTGGLTAAGAGGLLGQITGGAGAQTPAQAIGANQTTSPLTPNLPGYTQYVP